MPTCRSNIVELNWRSRDPGDLGIIDVKAPDPGEDCVKLTLGPAGGWLFFLAWGAYDGWSIGSFSIQRLRRGLQWGSTDLAPLDLGPAEYSLERGSTVWGSSGVLQSGCLWVSGHQIWIWQSTR